MFLTLQTPTLPLASDSVSLLQEVRTNRSELTLENLNLIYGSGTADFLETRIDFLETLILNDNERLSAGGVYEFDFDFDFSKFQKYTATQKNQIKARKLANIQEFDLMTNNLKKLAQITQQITKN